METKKAMGYFLLLLASVTGLGDAKSSSRDQCDFIGDQSHVDDKMLEERCFVYPEMVAMADTVTGSDESDEYKRIEIITQCTFFENKLFTGDAPDVEKVKTAFGRLNLFEEGLASCDTSLLESYKTREYYQCLEDACIESLD